MLGWEGKSGLVTCPFLHCFSIAEPHSGVHAVERSLWSGAGAEWSGVERMKRMKRSAERSGAEWSGAKRSCN